MLELLISVGIFSLVILIMTTVYTRFVASARRQISEQAIQQDLRFALELLQREARTGYADTLALTDGTGSSIVWRNQSGRCVNYRLQAGVLLRAAEASNSSGSCQLITTGATSLVSGQTKIDYLRFDPVPEQRLMTVIIQASSRQQNVPALALQTSVTSRQLTPYE